MDVDLIVTQSVFDLNITHNLITMADKAGLYYVMWRPEEIGVTTAAQAAPILRAGLHLLETQPEKFKEFEPENKWGSYDGLVKVVRGYLKACEENPEALIRVSR